MVKKILIGFFVVCGFGAQLRASIPGSSVSEVSNKIELSPAKGLEVKLITASSGAEIPSILLSTTTLYWVDQMRSQMYPTIDCSGAAYNSSTFLTTGSLVGCWEDISVSNNDFVTHISTARPTFDGNFVDYNLKTYATGSGARLYNLAVGAAIAGSNHAFAIYTVATVDTESTADQVLFAVRNSTDGDTNTQGRMNAGLETTAGRPNLKIYRENDAGTSHTTETEAGWGGAGIQVIGYEFNGSSVHVYQNGVLVLSSAAITGGFTFDRLTIGQSWDGTSSVGNSPRIFAQTGFSRIPSSTERAELVEFLMDDYGTPYSATPGNRVTHIIGDSHAQRSSSVQDFQHWYRLLQRNGLVASEAVRIVNRAVSGARVSSGTAPDIGEQWLDSVTYLSSTSLTCMIGFGNDARLEDPVNNDAEGVTLATKTAAEYLFFLSSAANMGADVINISVSPQTGTNAQRRHAIDYWNNSLMKPWCGYWDRCEYSDHYSLTKDATNQMLVAYDVGDGLHFNAAGIEVQRGQIEDAIDRLRYDPRNDDEVSSWWTARVGNQFFSTNTVLGSTVTFWTDRAGIFNATQTTSGNRPSWVGGEGLAELSNWKPLLLWDGSDDFFSINDAFNASNSDWGFGWISLFNDAGAIAGNSTSATSHRMYQGTCDTTQIIDSADGRLTFEHQDICDGVLHAYFFKRTSAGLETFYVDGIPADPILDTGFSGDWSPDQLGAVMGGADSYEAAVESIVYWAEEPSSASVNNFFNYAFEDKLTGAWTDIP